MQFFQTILLLGAAALAIAAPATTNDNTLVEKRCIADGASCTNDYTGCCSSLCDIAHDETATCLSA
ncbi:Uu.00g078280.m01.CDS01 [Anthostomella pinea]|uniref:Uu.00g078280.m01.CDS01 n=1 Tax=Anthostomella pinea TaxID=933095 RepID=A0AAI8VL95_9PEZI|nr:Uu.00g078280.m01.CDS01 [Anthostomella pinea]